MFLMTAKLNVRVIKIEFILLINVIPIVAIYFNFHILLLSYCKIYY